MKQRVFSIAIVLLFAGCASYPTIVDDWPSNLPDFRIFIDEYSADLDNQKDQSIENYLLWVKRFYQGWVVYDRGWLEMTDELKANINDPQERQIAEQKIHQIGLLIASEWAKEKESRYVKTGAVAAWGESLLKALSRGQALELMESVIQDIALLENGSLSSDEIEIERYYPDLAEGSEDGFWFF